MSKDNIMRFLISFYFFQLVYKDNPFAKIITTHYGRHLIHTIPRIEVIITDYNNDILCIAYLPFIFFNCYL